MTIAEDGINAPSAAVVLKSNKTHMVIVLNFHRPIRHRNRRGM